MRGKHTKRTKGAMVRRLVYYCIAVLTAAAVWAVCVKTQNPTADLTDVLTFIGAAFGGELLLLLLKRVWAKPNEEIESEG